MRNAKVPGYRRVSVKGLQILENHDILNKTIENDNISLKINPEKQNRHIKDSDEYIDGRSYLTISIEEAQKIVNEKHLTGIVHVHNNGNQIKEVLDLDTNIGVNVDGNTDSSTKRVTIHYSNTGTHIVPAKEDKNVE